MVGAISGAFFPSFYIVIFVFVSLFLMTVRTYFKAKDIYYAAEHKERKTNFGFEEIVSDKVDVESNKSNGILNIFL
jgi:hypothetical protein